MADITPNVAFRIGNDPGEDDGSLRTATWTNLNGANNTGVAIKFPQHSDRTVQVTGCFNAGTIVIEGSNDGSTYANLTDPSAGAASFTAAGIKQLVEAPLFVRPKVVANGAATDVAVTMLLRRNSPLTR